MDKGTIDWESKYRALYDSTKEMLNTNRKAEAMLKEEYLFTIKTKEEELVRLKKNLIALNRESKSLSKTDRLSLLRVEKERDDLKNEKEFLFDSFKKLKLKTEDSINLEKIFKSLHPLFFEKESSHVLFSIMVYAVSSPQGMDFLEKKLHKEKFIKHIVESYSFFMVENAKVETKKFMNRIESYEKDIFLRKLSLNIVRKKNIPEKLIFDAPKMGNAILLILNGLYKIINLKEVIDIYFSFDNSIFKVSFRIKINQKESFVLQKTPEKQVDELENLLSFKLSKKLISRLKGNFDISYKKDYYTISLDIPTKML